MHRHIAYHYISTTAKVAAAQELLMVTVRRSYLRPERFRFFFYNANLVLKV